VDKSKEDFLVFLHGNHQRKEIGGQKFVERISEIPLVVRSAREARRLRLRPEFKLRRLWTIGSSQKYPSATGLTRSFTRFKLREREEESSDGRHGHRNFGIQQIRGPEDRIILHFKIAKSDFPTRGEFRVGPC
jgi:hypothetical protein